MNDVVQRAKLAVWPKPAKFFHWLVVVLLVVAATLGFLADEQDLSPAKLKLFVTHKSFGLSVLLVMFLRVVWRVCSSNPKPVEGLSLMQQKLAGLGHGAIYAVAILLPLSGWLLTSAANFPFRWFDLFEVPLIWPADSSMKDIASDAHEFLFIALAALVLGHIAMAIRHNMQGLIVLPRMLPKRWGTGKFLSLLGATIGVVIVLSWSRAQSISNSIVTIVEGYDTVAAPSANVVVSQADPVSSLLTKPPSWVMRPASSELGFVGSYVGADFTGKFERFTPRIIFYAGRLAGASFDVSIDVTSAIIGAPDMDSLLGESQWLDFASFPTAQFIAQRFSRTTTGFVAHGLLRLKGIEQAVDLLFSWNEQADGTVRLLGEAVVPRVLFGVGDGAWADDPSVGFDVRVVVDVWLEQSGEQ